MRVEDKANHTILQPLYKDDETETKKQDEQETHDSGVVRHHKCALENAIFMRRMHLA